MTQQIQNPKGTRDFYPEEMAFEQHLFDSWHKSCKLYGFEQYEGPMFEHLELYTQKSGDEIEKQLYTLTDKGGRELALRPELTPTLARMVAARGTNLKRPVRWYGISRLFRYERMQKGRLREFIQLNMDILGESGVSADAELIAAAIGMMNALGLDSGDFKVRVSSRMLLEEIFLYFGIEREKLKPIYAILDKKNKIAADTFSAELNTIINDSTLSSKIENLFSCKTLDDISKIVGAAEIKSLAELKKLFAILDAYGLGEYVVFDIGIVRGLAYYTGIVFELFDAGGTMRAIAGGGRYDNLVGLYGGPPTPAVGFAVGDVVLADLIRAKGVVPAPLSRCDVFVVSLDKDESGDINVAASDTCGQVLRDVLDVVNKLRCEGISCEYSLKENQNVGKQLKSADNARARFALFVGGEEGKSGKMKLKNLVSGVEELVGSVEVVKSKVL